MLSEIYLAGAARTPIGSFCGVLSGVGAAELGATAIRGAVAKAALPAEAVDEVIFGNVISAGLGQNVARQCSLGAGLGVHVGATTVNKVCGSGLKAVMLAAQAIQCGDAALVIAGGTENMSRAPYLLDKARGGYRLGDAKLIDAMIRDGLWDVYNDLHMGACGDRCAERYHFTRQQQDDYAAASFRRALAAQAAGAFDNQIVGVSVGGKEPKIVAQDENPGRFDEAKLRRLGPAFSRDGTVTAANASSINDGAAALAVFSAAAAKSLHLTPQARILGYATAAREPEWFTLAPIAAIQRLLDRLSLPMDGVDLFEINEAFAVVPMAAMADLHIPHDRLNVQGGAVALGHPIGASGARILVTLLSALRRGGGRTGVCALCLGGGEAVAMAVQLL